MEKELMRRTLYKHARFEVGSRTERFRRITVYDQKENRDRHVQLRRNVIIEPSPPPALPVLETRRDKLLKWKAQKEAILQAQKVTKKPPFKIGAFQCSAIKDVTNIPPPPKSTCKSTAKSTTEKSVRSQPRQAKVPSAASQALSALSDTRRVTRSQAKQTVQQKGMKPPTMSKQPLKSGSKVVGSQKPQASFAPANHVFKAPTNLTFPVTPDVVKRTRSLKSTLTWPTVPGVEPLKAINSLNKSQTEKKAQASPKKRRSVRLATSKAPPAAPVNKEVSEKHVEASTSKIQIQVEDRGNVEDEDGVVAQKISRMSIHSPSRLEISSLLPGAIPAQFSPFIECLRGADRHKLRRSRGNRSVAEECAESLREKQVTHFRCLLDTETKRLLKLCDEWEGLKDNIGDEIPSDVQDMILGSVGQARLLTRDKFNQFKRLVDKFEGGETQEKMTADDLTGFWEMILVTVGGLDDQFKKLSALKDNAWKEEEKVVRKVPAKNPSAAIVPRTKTINPEALEQSRARIREARAAMKKMRQERREQSKKENEKTFDGGFFKVESPKRNTENEAPQKGPGTPKMRKSLLQQVLTNSANRVVKSPSVSDIAKRIRVSMMGRRVSLTQPEGGQGFVSPVPSVNVVPAKSILKSAPSAKRHTVVFTEDTSEKDSELAARPAPRRSLRFSVGTKFNDSPLI